jgi:hypothetical protein
LESKNDLSKATAAQTKSIGFHGRDDSISFHSVFEIDCPLNNNTKQKQYIQRALPETIIKPIGEKSANDNDSSNNRLHRSIDDWIVIRGIAFIGRRSNSLAGQSLIPRYSPRERVAIASQSPCR